MIYRKPDETIKIGGLDYRVDTDFRVWMKLSIAAAKQNDDALSKEIRDFCVMQGLPVSDDTFSAVLRFFLCGNEPEEKKRGTSKRERAYDFERDEALIVSAFRTQYGIDLRRDSLHWWDFMALFGGLKHDLPICEIMGYRTMDLSGMGKDQRKRYKALKDKYSLDVKRYGSLEERNQALKDRIKQIQREVTGQNGE